MKLMVVLLASVFAFSGCTKSGKKKVRDSTKVDQSKIGTKGRASDGQRRFVPGAGPSAATEAEKAKLKADAEAKTKADAEAAKIKAEADAKKNTPSGVPSFDPPVTSASQVKPAKEEKAGEQQVAIVNPPAKPAPVAPKTNTPEKKPEVVADSSSQEQEVLKLSGKEQNDLMEILHSLMGTNTFQTAITVIPGKGIDASTVKGHLEGTYEKAQMTLKDVKNELIAEFKDVSFSRSKVTNIRTPNYGLLSACMGSKCEVIFAVVYKFENKKVAENYPTLFKWNGKKYVKAIPASEAEMKSASTEGPVPPQLLILKKAGANREKTAGAVVTTLRRKMVNDNVVYSERMFADAKGASLTPTFKKAEGGWNFSMKVEFPEATKKVPVEFNTLLKAEMGKTTDKTGLNMYSSPLVKGEDFFIFIFENTKFESPLKDSSKAVLAMTCQILNEENEAYSDCDFLPADLVLEHKAIEGKIGGPLLLGLKQDGTPEILETLPKKD